MPKKFTHTKFHGKAAGKAQRATLSKTMKPKVPTSKERALAAVAAEAKRRWESLEVFKKYHFDYIEDKLKEFDIYLSEAPNESEKAYAQGKLTLWSKMKVNRQEQYALACLKMPGILEMSEDLYDKCQWSTEKNFGCMREEKGGHPCYGHLDVVQTWEFWPIIHSVYDSCPCSPSAQSPDYD